MNTKKYLMEKKETIIEYAKVFLIEPRFEITDGQTEDKNQTLWIVDRDQENHFLLSNDIDTGAYFWMISFLSQTIVTSLKNSKKYTDQTVCVLK